MCEIEEMKILEMAELNLELDFLLEQDSEEDCRPRLIYRFDKSMKYNLSTELIMCVMEL